MADLDTFTDAAEDGRYIVDVAAEETEEKERAEGLRVRLLDTAGVEVEVRREVVLDDEPP